MVFVSIEVQTWTALGIGAAPNDGNTNPKRSVATRAFELGLPSFGFGAISIYKTVDAWTSLDANTIE